MKAADKKKADKKKAVIEKVCPSVSHLRSRTRSNSTSALQPVTRVKNPPTFKVKGKKKSSKVRLLARRTFRLFDWPTSQLRFAGVKGH